MQELTPDGHNIVTDHANRFGFSQDAVTHMLLAVVNGNGSMAQFNHGEFGGSGQWMAGGMLMLGDMFNHGLKSRVDGLCQALAQVVSSQPGLLRSGSFQSQSQSGGSNQSQMSGGAPMGTNSLFVPDPEVNFWPSELGSPSATGNQNGVRYAYFGANGRLAVKTGVDVWVYDTQDHQIGGFSQQQGMGGSITFTSQYGTVDLNTLPVVMKNGQQVFQPVDASPVDAPSMATVGSFSPPNGNAPVGVDPLVALERLGDLHSKGILTDAEFSQKKAEILSRL